jgi:hypothetical protein
VDELVLAIAPALHKRTHMHGRKFFERGLLTQLP